MPHPIIPSKLNIFSDFDGTITVDDVKREVAAFFGLKLADLVSKRRTQDLVYPRQIAMYLSRQLTGSSLPVIGKMFGGRDHSTVIHACEKVKRKIAGEEIFRKQVDELTVRLSP